jgi:hypothetical protein
MEDKTWAHQDIPKSKYQLTQWHHTQSPRKKKFKIVPSAGKTMTTAFWDEKGVTFLQNSCLVG